MKTTCPISGLTYEVSFPDFGQTRAPHPMLGMSATALNETFLELHVAQQISSELTHLLGLAYLCKLPVVEIPALPANSHETMHAFWLKNMEKLARVCTKLENKTYIRPLPAIRATPENLPHLQHWLDDIQIALGQSAMPISDEARKLNSLAARSGVLTDNSSIHEKDIVESIMLRGLRGAPLKGKEAKRFPELIADWAVSVGEFPVTPVLLPSGKRVPLSQHWHRIITAAFTKDGTGDLLDGDVSTGDIEELIEYCYDQIPAGSIHATALWEKLTYLQENLEDYKARGSLRKIRPAAFKGTTEDLLAALGEPVTHSTTAPAASTDIASAILQDFQDMPSASTTKTTTMSLQDRLALKLAAAKRS